MAIDDKIAWYENTDGAGSFGTQQVISTAAGACLGLRRGRGRGRGSGCPLRLDVRRQDRLVREHGRGGQLRDPAGHLHRGDGARSVFAADVDGTGIWTCSPPRMSDDKIAWYENTDGAGSFGTQQIISTAAGRNLTGSVFAADVDGDGDTGCALRLLLRRQDRLVREHGRGGELRRPSR